MDETELVGLGEGKSARQQVLAQLGGPAFMRRGQRVENDIRLLRQQLELRRNDWLDMVRLRVGVLAALAGDWNNLRDVVLPHVLEHLQAIHRLCRPELRLPVEPTSSPRVLRNALAELKESVERFNRRWHEHVHAVDLEPINRRRDEYNRYYILEKECAVGSVRIARLNFKPLEPLTVAHLLEWVPALPDLER